MDESMKDVPFEVGDLPESLAVPPPPRVSPKELDRMPIIDVIRRRMLAIPAARAMVQTAIDRAAALEASPNTPDPTEPRRGIVTARIHDGVTGGVLDEFSNRPVPRRKSLRRAIGRQAL